MWPWTIPLAPAGQSSHQMRGESVSMLQSRHKYLRKCWFRPKGLSVTQVAPHWLVCCLLGFLISEFLYPLKNFSPQSFSSLRAMPINTYNFSQKLKAKQSKLWDTEDHTPSASLVWSSLISHSGTPLPMMEKTTNSFVCQLGPHRPPLAHWTHVLQVSLQVLAYFTIPSSDLDIDLCSISWRTKSLFNELLRLWFQLFFIL